MFFHRCTPIGWEGSTDRWIDALRRIESFEPQWVVPGHGPVPSAWPQALEDERRYFDVLAGDLRKAIADGVPLDKAVQTAGLGERGNWALFDDYNGRNATAAYAELEWE